MVNSFSIYLLMLLSMLFSASASYAQKAPPLSTSSRENERYSLASHILQAINNAELDYKTKHGTYASWQTLIDNSYFSDSGTKFISSDFPTVAHALYSSGTEIVPGWKLRLNISNNGKSYDAVLEDATDAKCSYACFTDERALIRQGKSVACTLSSAN
jgi:hypothetical protein